MGESNCWHCLHYEVCVFRHISYNLPDKDVILYSMCKYFQENTKKLAGSPEPRPESDK